MMAIADAPSEQRNPASSRIDQVSTEELLGIINAEDQKVADAVAAEIPRIVQAVDAIDERFSLGGRLFYVGAGTSGRLAVLDAAELPPTFNADPERVQALLAGGVEAMTRSIEGAEDDREAGAAELQARGLAPRDAVLGIASSGRTPFVAGALEYACSLGALTVALSGNPSGEILRHAQIAIVPQVGPEVIAGSTRMKGGTAQKLVLNMVSTALMVRRGYVLGDLMVNVQLTNEKLRDRARRIVMELSGRSAVQAGRALEEAGEVAAAVVMLRFDCSVAEARARLDKAAGILRRALEASGS